MKRNTLLLFFLVSVTGGLSWWLSDLATPERTAPRGPEQFPNAYARELTVITYNHQGAPQYKLTAPMMRHYEQDDTTELDRPLMWQYSGDKSPWKVRGEQAIMTGDKDSLYLAGTVTIDRKATKLTTPYHIVTRNLTVDTITAYAETEQPIRLDSQNHWVEAIGMQGWLQDPVKIILMSNVRGYYEFD